MATVSEPVHRMTSSLRAASLEETLAHAEALGRELGISRVTDTTWLDRIGIPVFASIRPDASPGSLCVNSGKGCQSAEARVGAHMEAIEYALAEPSRNLHRTVMTTPRGLSQQASWEFTFPDLCPMLGRSVDPDGPLAAVVAEDLRTGATVLVPAELVFMPYTDNLGQQIFGTSTNGLASGNTLAEATLHGLCEVIERDIRSFNYLRDASRPVSHAADIAPNARTLLNKISRAGCTGVLRSTPNVFGLPYFEAFILDPEEDDDSVIAISHGIGLHLDREIAAVRAISEAAQSRLVLIHGGRDDITESFDYFAYHDRDLRRDATRRLRARILNRRGNVHYAAVADVAHRSASISIALEYLLELLNNLDLGRVLRVILGAQDSPLAVVRIIVPGLESFQPTLRRVGPRLANHLGGKLA